MEKVQVITPDFVEGFAAWDEGERQKTLFLEPHPEYKTHFLVNSFNPIYVHDLRDYIGAYRAVSIFKLNEFLEKAKEEGYPHIFFTRDPSEEFSRLEHLSDPYPFELNITLKAFQLRGFNFLRDLPADVIQWSTGTGKAVYAVAKANYLLKSGQIDRVVVASRNHNKTNWSREFQKVASLEAVVADSGGKDATAKRAGREEIYNTSQIFIVNYEKFRVRDNKQERSSGDGQEIAKALSKKRVYFIFDEMPIALKNPKTAAYKGLKQIFKKTAANRFSMLSATPITHEPEDLYACVKLMTGSEIFTTLTSFRNDYARSFSPWAQWKVQTWNHEKLQELGMRIAHITHQADKYRDPEIRAQFPKDHTEDILIDMSNEDWKIYDAIKKELMEDFNLLLKSNPLAKISVLQLVCNNPLTLKQSDSEIARKILAVRTVTDQHAAKLAQLKEMLSQITGKIVIFSAYNELGSRMIAPYLTKWGHNFVLYTGTGKKMQEAEDRFKSDPSVRIFLSSDQGSDSINLQEASTVINYDYPWNWSTWTQRVNRIHRITSEAEHVFFYNLLTVGTIEERKKKIIEQKKSYHEATFGGDIADNAEALSTLSAGDLWWILSGEESRSL